MPVFKSCLARSTLTHVHPPLKWHVFVTCNLPVLVRASHGEVAVTAGVKLQRVDGILYMYIYIYVFSTG